MHWVIKLLQNLKLYVWGQSYNATIEQSNIAIYKTYPLYPGDSAEYIATKKCNIGGIHGTGLIPIHLCIIKTTSHCRHCNQNTHYYDNYSNKNRISTYTSILNTHDNPILFNNTPSNTHINYGTHTDR